MLSGRAPFQAARPGDDSSAKMIIERIRAGHVTFIGSQWERISQGAKDLIRGEIHINRYIYIYMCVCVHSYLYLFRSSYC